MMCGKKEEEAAECSQTMQSFQEQQFLLHQHHQQMHQNHQHQHHQHQQQLIFPEVSPILQPWSIPPVHSFNPAHFAANPVHHHHDPFLVPPPPVPSYAASLFNRRPPSLQFTYDGSSTSDHLRLISDTLGPAVHQQSGSAAHVPFGLQAELGKMTAQEIMDAKALAASKSHSEAERRRRERINNHLAKLRSLLPSTTKVSQVIEINYDTLISTPKN